MTVVKLAVEDLAADRSCTEELPPECFSWYYHTLIPGGVSGWAPQVVLDLPAGTYGLWGPGELSPFPAATLTVTGDPDIPVDGPEPQTASIIVTKKGIGEKLTFSVEGKLRSGPQIVEIVNAADQLLFIEARQIPWPPTIEQSSAQLAPDAVDEAQLRAVISTSQQSPGAKQWVVIDLTPGSVYLACYIPDPVATADFFGWYKGAAAVAPVSAS